MPTQSLDQHIELTPGIAGGKPRIAGHRITVAQVVIWHERLGKPIDEIASEYDLSLADLHAALAYYFDHRQAIDRSIAEGDEFIASLKQTASSPLAEKLKAQRGG